MTDRYTLAAAAIRSVLAAPDPEKYDHMVSILLDHFPEEPSVQETSAAFREKDVLTEFDEERLRLIPPAMLPIKVVYSLSVKAKREKLEINHFRYTLHGYAAMLARFRGVIASSVYYDAGYQIPDGVLRQLSGSIMETGQYGSS